MTVTKPVVGRRIAPRASARQVRRLIEVLADQCRASEERILVLEEVRVLVLEEERDSILGRLFECERQLAVIADARTGR